MTKRLPAVGGRAPRVALLVYGTADTDSRVLKSAASLEEAGAETLVIGMAPKNSALPEGPGRSPGGVRLHRTRDLDLVRTFNTAARVWRRLRGRDPGTGAPLSSEQRASSADPDMAAAQKAAVPAAEVLSSPSSPSPSLRRFGVEAYLRGYKTARLVRYWVGAISVAHRFRADVVQANDGNTLTPALILRALRGSRVVYDSHELWLRRNVGDRWLAPSIESLTERIGVRYADSVITVSPSIVQWLQDRYEMRQEPLLVRNIPVWTGALPTRDQGRLRELAGLDPDAQVISYCGGLTRGRGLEETVDALTLLPEHVHLVLLGFGSPGYVNDLRKRARRAGVGERVHLVGTVPGPEVPQALADADLAVVYVRPIVLSYLFSLPNKLFESIHAGLPIVSADLPDTAALVREHGIGEVFSEGTPAELAAAIQTVLDDPEPYRVAVAALAPHLDWRHEAARLIEAHTRAVTRCRT